MITARLKVLQALHDEKAKTLTLRVAPTQELPAAGDYIFLKASPHNLGAYRIRRVKKLLFRRGVSITVESSGPDRQWTERIAPYISGADDTVFSGISPQQFHELSVRDQSAYFLSVVALYGSPRVHAFIQQHIEPSLRLAPADGPYTGGLSKLGGLPLAPEGFRFPKDPEGRRAVHFLGQLHIGELNQHFSTTRRLRGDGVLYFFATIAVDEEDGWEPRLRYSYYEGLVEYAGEVKNGQPVPLPEDVQQFGAHRAHDLHIVERLSIPDIDTSRWEGPEMTEEERSIYRELDAILEEYCEYSNSHGLSGNKLLGHPFQVQGCVLLEAEFKQHGRGWYTGKGGYVDPDHIAAETKALAPQSRSWQVLFEFDAFCVPELPDFDGSFNEYESGRYYIMIQTEDLERMDFSKTITIYQHN